MKLYSLPMSPFAARPRLAIYAKGLDIEILPPPGGTRSPEYLAINPIGKAPALVLGDGTVIPESETIVEYLEDAFPEPALRPETPEGKARARLVARVGEIYVAAPLTGLFRQAMSGAPDKPAVAALVGELEQGLTHLNYFLSGEGFAAGPRFTTADCCVAPMLFYVRVMGAMNGRTDLFDPHDKLAAYVKVLVREDAVLKVFGEMQTGLDAWTASRGRGA